MVATALQIAGLAAVVIGIGLLSIPASVIAMGIGCVLVGYAMERE